MSLKLGKDSPLAVSQRDWKIFGGPKQKSTSTDICYKRRLSTVSKDELHHEDTCMGSAGIVLVYTNPLVLLGECRALWGEPSRGCDLH